MGRGQPTPERIEQTGIGIVESKKAPPRKVTYRMSFRAATKSTPLLPRVEED